VTENEGCGSFAPPRGGLNFRFSSTGFFFIGKKESAGTGIRVLQWYWVKVAWYQYRYV